MARFVDEITRIARERGGIDPCTWKTQPVWSVGSCEVCGVTFAAAPEVMAVVVEVLRVHQLICPGGDRSAEVVAPFASEGWAPPPVPTPHALRPR